MSTTELSRLSPSAEALGSKIEDNYHAAIKAHGRHSFFDKGPREVMDTNYLSQQCRAHGVKDTYEAFKWLITRDADHSIAQNARKMIVGALLSHLENWDELWDSYDEVALWY